MDWRFKNFGTRSITQLHTSPNPSRGRKTAEAGRILSHGQVVSPCRVRFNHLDFARNSFELYSINTSKYHLTDTKIDSLKITMDLKSTYNKIAKDWMSDHHGYTWWIEGTDKFLSYLKPKASVLDVGCGAGEKSVYMAKKGFDVTGIDFSEEMIRLTKEQLPMAKFYIKDIKKPLGLENTFDGIFAFAVLLHISKDEVVRVLKNMIEPLKTNGYFFVAVKELRPGKEDEEIVKENNYGYAYERFFSYFTIDELRKYITDIGLQIVSDHISLTSKRNWIQIIAKK